MLNDCRTQNWFIGVLVGARNGEPIRTVSVRTYSDRLASEGSVPVEANLSLALGAR
jgi:hypothetical protein